MKFALVALLSTASAIHLNGDYYHARDIGTGSLDKKYERVPPARFSGDGDDLFMRSMIMKYAMEGKTGEDEKEPQLENSSWMKPPPELPPKKFLEPIRDSREL